MEEQFLTLCHDAKSAIASAADLDELQALRVRFLGKKAN